MIEIKVRVIGDPGGIHAQWVKDAWKGVEFEARRMRGKVAATEIENGVHKTVDDPWVVDQAHALNALRAAGKTEAYNWWLQRGYPKASMEFIFDAASCEPV